MAARTGSLAAVLLLLAALTLAAGADVYYVNPGGEAYHRAGCRFIAPGAKRLGLAAAAELATEHRPCRSCKPPLPDPDPQEPAPAPETAAETTPAKAPEAAAPVAGFHLRSPYTDLAKTRQLVNTLALRTLTDYVEVKSTEPARPGVELTRVWSRVLAGGGARSLTVDISTYPEKGWEIYLRGNERHGSIDAPNPDQATVEQALTELAGTLDQEQQAAAAEPVDLKTLSYEVITLSYVQTDHALALLKALGYKTIEYQASDSESVWDKLFVPNELTGTTLPVVVKLADSTKTSLQDPAPGEMEKQKVEALPDLGGVYLHHVTAGDPQQRLLIVYSANDLAALQKLLNLIRDQVDVPARQVVIEALVIELQTDVARDLGVSWESAGVTSLDNYKDKFGLQLGPQPVATDLTPFAFNFSRLGVADLFAFKATVKALIDNGKAQILSNPSVLVLDGRQAKIQIGNKIPVTQVTITNNATSQSFEYFPVGIVLNLKPRVSESGEDVVMQVETIVSSIRTSLTGNTPAGTAPTVESRQVQTFVRVANDTPFIIGGLTSKEETSQMTGVPGLSELPLVGKLFAHNHNDSLHKEIIVVVTPHVVPAKEREFSLVIPQQTPIFDSFGHELFRNAYRIRDQDVFELKFLYESRAYRNLRACAQTYAAAQPAGFVPSEAVAAVLRGEVPGEDVLVLKMLFELVRKTNYLRFVNPEKIFVFEDTPTAEGGSGYKRFFLPEKLAQVDKEHNALVMSFDARAEGTPEHPFWQPRAVVSFESLTPPDYDARVADANSRTADGKPDRWSIVITDAYTGRTHPLDILKGVIVLRRLLELNQDLPLTIAGFHAGRQLVFPTENDLRDRFHLVDTDTAKLFYEVSQYYPDFEIEFKHQGRDLASAIGGCEGWDSGDIAPPRAPNTLTP